MTEADFRDWVRAQLSGLEGRVRTVEARAVEKPRPRTGGRFKGGMVKLAEGVLQAVKSGEVTGVAVVYLGPGGPQVGWSSSGGFDGHLMLLGAATSLIDDLLHPDAERHETFLEEAAA
jgi:hypothetical protein